MAYLDPARQSFAVLRGAVLRLQDGEDEGEAAEGGPEVVERPPGEEHPHGDQTDDGHGPQSPRKQEQSQHLHLMVELLRPQDDIRLVRGGPEPLEKGGEPALGWGGEEGGRELAHVSEWGAVTGAPKRW